jgi:capsular exopolysaccharide synthesis family protein
MSSKYQLIVKEQNKSPISEAYRGLRTNLNFCKAEGELKTIMFTSAGPGEGKSITAANTAVALAQNGKQVLIVDCDLRKPVQYKIFNQGRNGGITNILVGDEIRLEFINETEVKNLFLLASGPVPPNPSEILGSDKMTELLGVLRSQYDYILIDAPPVVAVTDSCVLASKLDGVILVLGTDTVRPEMAKKAKELLIRARGQILGVVLNRVELEMEYMDYYYYYGNQPKVAR